LLSKQAEYATKFTPCINDVAHSRKWRHLANIMKLLFPAMLCVVTDVSGAF